MGSCAGKNDFEIVLPNLAKLYYPRVTQIKITVRDEMNKIIGYDKVKVTLKIPIKAKAQHILLNNIQIAESHSIIPGMDPREQYPKDCQDGCFVQSLKTTDGKQLILAGLFDGHGKEGTNVVKSCKKFMRTFFKENTENVGDNYADKLKQAFESCEIFLKQQSGIDVQQSGCTCILTIISQDIIATASIGDSRGILGFLKDKKIKNLQEGPDLKKKIRKVIPSRKLEALQLTVDQKPEHQEEYKRIMQHGGSIRRIKDNLGNEVGPYRVYKGSSVNPGLAMSR